MQARHSLWLLQRSVSDRVCFHTLPEERVPFSSSSQALSAAQAWAAHPTNGVGFRRAVEGTRYRMITTLCPASESAFCGGHCVASLPTPLCVLALQVARLRLGMKLGIY